MLENQQNKMQKKDTVKTEEVQFEQEYHFPDAGITIKAKSIEEAQAKLQEILNNK